MQGVVVAIIATQVRGMPASDNQNKHLFFSVSARQHKVKTIIVEQGKQNELLAGCYINNECKELHF